MSIIGQAAPSFSGPAAKNGEIVNISLSDYSGKWLVLFFYPLDFTFVCPTEIVAFSDATAAFSEINTEILGVSVDSVHTHLAYTRTSREEAGVGAINFPLLSDISKSIAADYDVLNGAVALRGVFIIDPEGNVQSATVNNLSVGRNVQEVLRTVQAFQYVAENGATCPANWVAGSKGMDASLTGVKSVIN